MSSDISVSSVSRPDVVAVESGPRPTPTPVRVDFKRALESAGVMAVRGATAVASVLPGGPQLATALRGPAVPFAPGPMTPLSLPGASAATPGVSTDPAGPGGTGGATVGVGGTSTAGDAQSALQQMQDQEMNMLMIQQQASATQNYFMTMSNLEKSTSDTEKSAIQNIK